MTFDTFHNLKKKLKRLSTIFIQTQENFEFMLKVSLEETPFTIPKKMELYLDVFHNFLKIGFILKVSLQETLSTIFIHSEKFRILKRDILQFLKNRIILKVSLDTFHN